MIFFACSTCGPLPIPFNHDASIDSLPAEILGSIQRNPPEHKNCGGTITIKEYSETEGNAIVERLEREDAEYKRLRGMFLEEMEKAKRNPQQATEQFLNLYQKTTGLYPENLPLDEAIKLQDGLIHEDHLGFITEIKHGLIPAITIDSVFPQKEFDYKVNIFTLETNDVIQRFSVKLDEHTFSLNISLGRDFEWIKLLAFSGSLGIVFINSNHILAISNDAKERLKDLIKGWELKKETRA